MRQAWRGKLHKSKFINRLDIDLQIYVKKSTKTKCRLRETSR